MAACQPALERALNHLFLCREYAPAAYPPGGIGTYVRHITRLLADAGETVHVIAHRWAGAASEREEHCGGRLLVHRVALDGTAGDTPGAGAGGAAQVPSALLASAFPAQAFSWAAALLAEQLIADAGIDVIEAQEWEAPLYYLQLRRRLELGPARRPPCVVHLHSSTEQIFAANAWDTRLADYAPAVAQEQFSITAADALLAPSHFIAAQVAKRHAISPARIQVIPYPLGDSAPLRRDEDVWARASVCQVGRLEPRKGVLEWVDAVIAVSAEHPDLSVEFIGADTPLKASGGGSVMAALRQRIPSRMRHRFRFLGVGGRAQVLAVLARNPVAVVPSRWENFPYSCIEAMGSGLPVIVSPNGGMQELVVDGQTGWVAPDATSGGLAAALERALATPAAVRARMGAAAAQAVARICSNDEIVQQHLLFKRGLVRATASKVPVPADLAANAHAGRPASAGTVRVIVRAQGSGPDDASALQAAAQMLQTEPSLVALVFIDARLQLDPEFIERCRAAFGAIDRLGLLSCWIHELAPRDRVHIQPDSTRPNRWKRGSMAPCFAVGAEAFARTSTPGDHGTQPSLRDVCDRIVAEGWVAMTYPAVLASIRLNASDPSEVELPSSSMARALKRLHTPPLRWLLDGTADDRRGMILQALRNPLSSVRWLARRAAFSWRRRT